MKKLEDIRQIKRSVEQEFLTKEGVTGVEVGYKVVDGKRTNEISIRVLVKKKKDVSQDQMIPPIIRGVKTDVIEREYAPSLKVRLEDVKPSEVSLPDTDSYNPLIGGISIGPARTIAGSVYAGTLGTLVIDNSTNSPMILSNYHVLAVDNTWNVGDDIYQPSVPDGGTSTDVVAQLQRAVIGNSPDVSSINGQNFSVDCAVASVTPDRGVICQIVEIQMGASGQLGQAGNISGTEEAALGMSVLKRGRTTGLTFGTVDAIDSTVMVTYGGSIGTITFTNQISIEPVFSQNAAFSGQGDSGSAICVLQPDGSVQVVGLLFADNSADPSAPQSTSANQIQAVLDALQITICSNVPPTTISRAADAYAMNIKAEAMNIKAEAMNIKAEAMNIKAEAMNIKAEAMNIKADSKIRLSFRR
jgi:hypothetical protein